MTISALHFSQGPLRKRNLALLRIVSKWESMPQGNLGLFGRNLPHDDSKTKFRKGREKYSKT